MTRSFSVSELAKLASVTPRAVYQWLADCPADLKAKLGELGDAGRFDLVDAQAILKVGKREELANLLGELALAQEYVPPEPEPDFSGDVVFIAPPRPGRPPRRRIAAWVSVEDLAGGSENRARITAALYRANAMMETIHNATYVAMESLPVDLLAPIAARLRSGDEEVERFRLSASNDEGEVWVKGTDIAGALGWGLKLVTTRGWRTPWRSRKPEKYSGLEYELSSLPEDLQLPVLRYLMSKAA